MIGMFDRDWQTSLPLSKIAKIVDAGTEKDGGRRHRLYMEGEDMGFELSGFAYARIASTPLQLIPAQPGISALSVCIDEGEAHVGRAPVIGWARCFDGSVRVVTPAGVDDGHLWKEGQGYILLPDGTVHAVGEYLDYVSFDSLEDYTAHELDQERQRAEARP
jgi:hypothetical protein